jgi:mono/diheme cytochrome c family protein
MSFAARLAAACVTLAALHPTLSAADEPHMVYMLNCMGCHTADGRGSPGHVPSVRATLGPLAADREGRRFLVEVPGVAQSQLSNAAVAQLLNWMVRNLTAEPAEFVEFTPQEVARYRAQRLTTVYATRAQILSRISAASTGTPAGDAIH